MTEAVLSAVVLSRGATWNPLPHQPPYLTADPGRPWPDGDDAYIVFYDSAGTQLVRVDGTVTPDAITFTADAALMDQIPAGAGFEVFLDTDDGLFQVRYGKVVRREAQFLQSPAVTTTYQALQFTDTFPTLGLRSSWQPVAGKTAVYDNTASSLPNGVSADPGFLYLGGQNSAIRWFAPMNSDSVRISVNLLNGGTAKTTVVLCADQRFTSYLGVQFDEPTHRIHLCTGSGAFTQTYQGSAITNTVANGDNYTITYSQSTGAVAVFKGASTSPLGSWTDSGHVVPHGPGYRYTGLSFANGFISAGLQVSYWSAKDDV